MEIQGFVEEIDYNELQILEVGFTTSDFPKPGDGQSGKVAVSWLKILAANPNHNPTILSHETAT